MVTRKEEEAQSAKREVPSKTAAPTVNQENRAADQHDGQFHDPVNWQGQTVEYVEDIGTNDPEYDGSVQKVRIVLTDGTPKVVPKAQILRETTTEHRTFAPDRKGGPMPAAEADKKK